MYGYHWLGENEIFILDVNNILQKEIRPVFKEELDLFGMNKVWKYPKTDKPILWAEGIRRYVLNGECIADAKGGGFYTMPKIDIKNKDIKELKEINIDLLLEKNTQIMKGLTQRAINFIRSTYEDYSKKGYKFVVTFSGGKDSIVLLDLVQRALAPDQFIVIFGDTGMELSYTYKAVELAKEKWSNLNFQIAKSDFSAEESWEAFGPPGRRLRWCCAVHKSVPVMLLLREITNQNKIKVVLFNGVRAEESEQRSRYIEVSEGKHSNQVNGRPILDWNSAEIFLYIFERNILLNGLYRFGFNRVGCTVCPSSSKWKDAISNQCFGKEIQGLLKKVETFTSNALIAKGQRKNYIENGGWRARMGGRGLPNGGNRVNELIENNSIKFMIMEYKQNWVNVARLLGPIVERDGEIGEQVINGKTFNFYINLINGLTISYSPFDKMDRAIISGLRGVANKVAYCVGCKTCVIECPTGAFLIDENRKIKIKSDKCTHCMNCIRSIEKSCWAARALAITQGGNGMDLRGMDRYQNFGLRISFLSHFFDMKNDCWNSKELGNKQYNSLKAWLKEAEIINISTQTGNNGQITELGEKLIQLGPYNSFVWSVIWTNLSYNSNLVKWYLLCVPTGGIYEKNELISLIDNDCSNRTKENAIVELLELLRHSPIGNVLEMGVPIPQGNSFKFYKKGWETPEAASILYAFYRYSEKIGGHYDLTLKELESIRKKHPQNFIGMEPATIFGLSTEKFKEIAQALSIQYPNLIKTSFIADLDNIKLNKEKTSNDVIDIVLKGE